VKKLVVFDGEDFGYWKNQTHNYLLSQGCTIWEIIHDAYIIPTKYENNYKSLNLITIALGRNVYDRISHLKSAHAVWEKLCNTFDGMSEIKSTRKDTYNR
jgi:hypothetical protein